MIKLISTLALFVFVLSIAHAIDRVTVGDRTFVCETRCWVQSGPPATVSDRYGGYVGEIQRDAEEVT